MYPSIVRTLVPLVVGFVLAQAAKYGLNLPESMVTEAVTAGLALLYFVVARALEQYAPSFGRVLLSAGLTGRAPLYVKERADTGPEH